MTDPTQAAEKLALDVWDLIADRSHDPALVTDEKKAEIRSAAFLFSRNARGSDYWRVVIGKHLAGALLMWLDDPSPENFRALQRASERFESLRISPPTK